MNAVIVAAAAVIVAVDINPAEANTRVVDMAAVDINLAAIATVKRRDTVPLLHLHHHRRHLKKRRRRRERRKPVVKSQHCK